MVVMNIKEENWKFNAFIKINSKVEEKKTNYKNLFVKWRSEGQGNSKGVSGRINKEDLKHGLVNLKTGLTATEIDDLLKELKFDIEDGMISFKDFADEVTNGAKQLQNQKKEKVNRFKSYVEKLTTQIKSHGVPIEKLFL